MQKHTAYQITAIITIAFIAFPLFAPLRRTFTPPTQRKHLQARITQNPQKTRKELLQLEKEKNALLTKYKRQAKHAQKLRNRNHVLVASIENLESELAVTTVREQALRA